MTMMITMMMMMTMMMKTISTTIITATMKKNHDSDLSQLYQVRHVAVANEGPFGVTRMCEHAIWDDLPKIACVQQEYNLFTQNKVEMGEISFFQPTYCCRSKGHLTSQLCFASTNNTGVEYSDLYFG